jgi:2-oxoglutarate dehydrogenase E1 component
MYRLWKEDPAQVHPSWNVYFSGMARGLKSEDAFRPPPSLVDLESMTTEGSADVPSASTGSDVQDHMKVSSIRNSGIVQ